MDSDRIASPLLLGHAHPECVIPNCACTLESTGFLVRHEGALAGWYMEFRCPDHGIQFTAGGRWQGLIAAVLRETGAG